MEVKDLIKKLMRPQWFPQDIYTVVKNPYGIEGAMNIAWVLNGKPKKFKQSFFDTNWQEANDISESVVDGYKVKEWATLLTILEFSDFVERNPRVFARYMPIKDWVRALGKGEHVLPNR